MSLDAETMGGRNGRGVHVGSLGPASVLHCTFHCRSSKQGPPRTGPAGVGLGLPGGVRIGRAAAMLPALSAPCFAKRRAIQSPEPRAQSQSPESEPEPRAQSRWHSRSAARRSEAKRAGRGGVAYDATARGGEPTEKRSSRGPRAGRAMSHELGLVRPQPAGPWAFVSSPVRGLSNILKRATLRHSPSGTHSKSGAEGRGRHGAGEQSGEARRARRGVRFGAVWV